MKSTSRLPLSYNPFVQLLGRTEITTIEEPDHLQFVVVRRRGWISLVGPPATLLVFALWALMAQHYVFAVFSAVAIFALIANYIRGPVTKLLVSQGELIARGNLDRTFIDQVKVEASDVKFLGYFMGGENDPSGLYADRGWRQTCLLPGLNKDEANAIAHTIRSKFPNLERGDTSPASLFFSGDGGVQTLSLSKDTADASASKP
jgi:hypothetical protein